MSGEEHQRHSRDTYETIRSKVPGGELVTIVSRVSGAVEMQYVPNVEEWASIFGSVMLAAIRHSDPRLDQVLSEVRALRSIMDSVKQEVHSTGVLELAKLDDLEAEVAANTSVTDSVVVLMNSMAAQIEAAGTDQAKLDALAASLRSNDQRLANAVTANTPTPPADPNA